MKEIFTKYLAKFDMDNDKIKLKYHHSLRVMSLCEIIAKSLDMTDREVYLAKIMGLFHDIARFKQVKEYDTFSDAKSFDHGDVGYQIFLKDIVPKLDLDSDEIKIVSQAIKYHNKYSIPKLPVKIAKFSKIIRDADKVDILFICGQRKLEISSDEPSAAVESVFNNHQNILNDIVQNDYDYFLRTLALIYDINFQKSIDIIKENRYLDLFLKNYDSKVKKYIKEINKFMEDFDGNKI